MFKKLGELWAAFVLGKTLQEQQELLAAESWEKVTAENREEFFNWVAENFEDNWLDFDEDAPPLGSRSKASKKKQVEALEKIWSEYSIKEYKDDFNEGANSIYNENEVSIEEETQATEVTEDTAPVDFSGDEATQVPEEVIAQTAEEQLIIDTELYDKHATIMMPGVPAEQVMAYVAANEATLSAPEIAMLTAHAEGVVTRPQRFGDKVYLTPFSGHFQGVGLDNIIDSYASGPEIRAYQNFLQNNNIVPQNYFAESYGEYSEKLRTSIKMVMTWLDRNRFAVEGTELYTELMNETENAPVFFTKLQEDNEEFSYYRNLFNYGLKEMAKDRVALDEAAEAESARKLAEEFIPPSDDVLDDMVESWFQAKLNRKPTAAELDTWSTRFANSYSIAFAQQRAKNKELESFNFMTAQPQYAGLNEQEVAELQEEYPGKGFVDLSMFSTSTPEEIMSGQIEGQYGDMIEDVEDAEQVRKMQQDMLTYMFGG